MSLLNKIANDDIVEVLDGHPLDAFTQVFFLLGLQGQLDEQLLQFLIAEVDTELFKTENK